MAINCTVLPWQNQNRNPVYFLWATIKVKRSKQSKIWVKTDNINKKIKIITTLKVGRSKLPKNNYRYWANFWSIWVNKRVRILAKITKILKMSKKIKIFNIHLQDSCWSICHVAWVIWFEFGLKKINLSRRYSVVKL